MKDVATDPTPAPNDSVPGMLRSPVGRFEFWFLLGCFLGFASCVATVKLCGMWPPDQRARAAEMGFIVNSIGTGRSFIWTDKRVRYVFDGGGRNNSEIKHKRWP